MLGVLRELVCAAEKGDDTSRGWGITGKMEDDLDAPLLSLSLSLSHFFSFFSLTNLSLPVYRTDFVMPNGCSSMETRDMPSLSICLAQGFQQNDISLCKRGYSAVNFPVTQQTMLRDVKYERNSL